MEFNADCREQTTAPTDRIIQTNQGENPLMREKCGHGRVGNAQRNGEETSAFEPNHVQRNEKEGTKETLSGYAKRWSKTRLCNLSSG
jgi:hypothetical protein